MDSAGGSLIDSSEVSSMGSPSQNDLEDEPNKSDLDSSASSITSYKDSNTGLNYGHTQNEGMDHIDHICLHPMNQFQRIYIDGHEPKPAISIFRIFITFS